MTVAFKIDTKVNHSAPRPIGKGFFLNSFGTRLQCKFIISTPPSADSKRYAIVLKAKTEKNCPESGLGKKAGAVGMTKL